MERPPADNFTSLAEVVLDAILDGSDCSSSDHSDSEFEAASLKAYQFCTDTLGDTSIGFSLTVDMFEDACGGDVAFFLECILDGPDFKQRHEHISEMVLRAVVVESQAQVDAFNFMNIEANRTRETTPSDPAWRFISALFVDGWSWVDIASYLPEVMDKIDNGPDYASRRKTITAWMEEALANDNQAQSELMRALQVCVQARESDASPCRRQQNRIFSSTAPCMRRSPVSVAEKSSMRGSKIEFTLQDMDPNTT